MTRARGAALVVFAKEPVPGQVKTRLSPPLTPEQAAALYAEMLADVLDTSARWARAHSLSPFLSLHPGEAAGRVPHPETFRIEPQVGVGLAERMENAAAARFAEGYGPVLLRGSDSPALGEATLEAALHALTRHDVVLCPDRDGGYNLVGLSRPTPGLFDHPMSTGSVLADTIANARRAGRTHQVLEPGFDIDTIEDLERLKKAREQDAAGECPRTLAWLDAHAAWELHRPPSGA
ncbi:MAG: TIGR04282 family arsenosugar biosynthesis glycosyltransferase [Myxococcota bacterium]|nr:TIGR04282 family arsenosugar biosynthesis glycosyltransferase [Myxococcota bacterium]